MEDEEGSEVLVAIYIDKSNRLAATMNVLFFISGYTVLLNRHTGKTSMFRYVRICKSAKLPYNSFRILQAEELHHTNYGKVL